MSTLKHRTLRKPNFTTKGCWVYRVEDDEGRGPFKPNGHNFNKDKHWFNPKRKRELLYRTPTEEFPIDQLMAFGFFKVNSNLRFGCKTIKQLLTWFNSDELKKLAQQGYKVKRVWASRVLDGKDQCLFIRKGV